ncbi:MAG: barstar family protein [Defluviitaleaceae bacterium]|nr:barstar family protein [Defluviitaleaceae bacterium]
MIKNEMRKISYEEVQKILKTVPDDFLVVELDGEKLQTWEQYSLAIEEKMRFPTTCFDNIDRYEDWICDLEWLGKEGYVIIIYNFSSFMKNNPKIKEAIMSGFDELILPWWQKEVEVCTDYQKIKSFNVYLVN